MNINGIDIHHVPLTLRNDLLCKAAYTKAKEYSQSKNLELVLRNLARIRKAHPEVAELVDELGMLNSDTLLATAERLKMNHRVLWEYENKEPTDDVGYITMDDDTALSIARAEMEANLQTYLKDNPNIGKQMYFDMQAFPVTIDALRIGIDIIKDTYDRSKLTDEEIQKIEGPKDNEYWQNVTASEVADFVNKFCQCFK